MKRIFLIAIFSAIAISTASAFEGRMSVSFGVFYDALRPYGEWVSVGDYGYCWHPYVADRYWRPYSNGRWVWSDDGWMWVSYDDWGWAPYHYGRWTYDGYYGWVWVADYEWAPAWVQWRMTDGYIGWAPLPPYARWHGGFGVDYNDYGIPNSSWCFTTSVGFYVDHPVIFGIERNYHFIHMTRNITNIYRDRDRIFVGGPDRGRIERFTHSRISPVEIEDFRGHDGTGWRATQFDGNRVRIYRPEVRPDTRQELGSRIHEGSTRGRMEENREARPGNADRRPEQVRPEGMRDQRGGQHQYMMQNPAQRPGPDRQPRFNIPDRRQSAPPQFERRQAQPQPQNERRSEGRPSGRHEERPSGRGR